MKLADVQGDIRATRGFNWAIISFALIILIIIIVVLALWLVSLYNRLVSLRNRRQNAFSDIDVLFYTGGSTKVPLVREKINVLCPNAKIVEGDPFGSVGLGLTIEAKRLFGV